MSARIFQFFQLSQLRSFHLVPVFHQRFSFFCKRFAGRGLLIGVMLGLQQGCASHGQPLVADRSPVFGPAPASYAVLKGDTLYSVAWRFGFDVKALAARNSIVPPYTIYPGQRLDLSLSTAMAVAGATGPQTVRNKANSAQPVVSGSLPADSPTATPSTQSGQLRWRNPVAAAPRQKFGAQNKGLNYQLPGGTRVLAAASGTVVYAGTGLGGFRELIIIDHGADYLSAYNYQGLRRVKESQFIQVGTTLADIADNVSTEHNLHFEIRLRGRPQNPDRLLIP